MSGSPSVRVVYRRVGRCWKRTCTRKYSKIVLALYGWRGMRAIDRVKIPRDPTNICVYQSIPSRVPNFFIIIRIRRSRREDRLGHPSRFYERAFSSVAILRACAYVHTACAYTRMACGAPRRERGGQKRRWTHKRNREKKSSLYSPLYYLRSFSPFTKRAGVYARLRDPYSGDLSSRD